MQIVNASVLDRKSGGRLLRPWRPSLKDNVGPPGKIGILPDYEPL
jgi:hypothetical protein